MKKIYAVFLTAVVLSVSGCGGVERFGEEESSINPSQTQLYVGTYDGGLDQVWLEKAAARFEEKYAGVSFEEGKTGVQVRISKSKSYGTTSLVNVISTSREEVFFVELSDYYELINKGKLLEITEAVTEPLTEYGETESIEDKMYDSDVSFFRTSDGKYYGVPFYEAAYGIFYDIDLFEEMNFFFAAQGQGDKNGFVNSPNTPRSNGPDGKAGTSDDGLPATYEEFYKLCDKMVASNVTPFTWAGSVSTGTTNFLMRSLWADYEGKEQMELNYTFNGTAADLVDSFDASGKPVLTESEITNETGYLLQKQAGKYYALEFMENIFSDSEYYNGSKCFSQGYAHTTAQEDFLKGRFTSGAAVYGMLVDGTWWFNEASNVFEDMENIPGAGKNERRLAFMPLPKATPEKAGDFTYMSCYLTECVIRSNIDQSKRELAKAFLRFVHTDESLAEFTMTTNTIRPFEYSLSEEDMASASYYLRSLVEIHNNSDIVVPYAANNLYLSNVNQFIRADGQFNSKVGSKEYNFYLSAWRADGISAKDYFEGLAAYWNKEQWASTYQQYF